MIRSADKHLTCRQIFAEVLLEEEIMRLLDGIEKHQLSLWSRAKGEIKKRLTQFCDFVLSVRDTPKLQLQATKFL